MSTDRMDYLELHGLCPLPGSSTLPSQRLHLQNAGWKERVGSHIRTQGIVRLRGHHCSGQNAENGYATK